MNNNRYCVIMAGGIGSRFWPLSREDKPKQFLDILGVGKSFIRQTFERFLDTIPVENFLVVTSHKYKSLVLDHIPELRDDQVLCEPLRRNTAPCIAYAAYKIKAKNPNATMIVTPSDHLIINQPEFSKIVKECMDMASDTASIVTIGINPSRPETGYGYIQIMPEGKDKPFDKIHQVKTFTEKPNLEMAKVFMDSGEFFWNSGIFIWSVDTIIKSLEKYLPEVAQTFSNGENYYNTDKECQFIQDIYPDCKNISIDYGIMEKAENVYVRCGDFGWSDIGTWGSLYAYSNKDNDGNVTTRDNVMTYNATNCIIKVPSDKLAVIDGLDEYIVIDNDGVLLICRQSNEQNIKQFVEDIKINKDTRFL